MLRERVLRVSIRMSWGHALSRRRRQRRIPSVGLAHHWGRNRRAGIDAVLADNLLEGRLKNFPWEYLNILLNVAGFGVGKAHDDLEELLTIWLSLRDCLRMEAFQVTADAVLLLDTETVRRCDQLLEKVDSVDRCDITLAFFGPPDA